MATLAETALNLLGVGFGVYAHHKQLQQQQSLHDHEHATSTSMHFSSLSTELLAIAKEADRDVWEQRNNQYNQMLVCAVLMFGVAFGNINEGTYSFDKVTDHQGTDLVSIFSKDGVFVLMSGAAIASLFVCIVACLLVMRRMSSYMIERSSNLVDRLAVSTGLAHQIAGAAQEETGHGPGQHGTPTAAELEEILGGSKRRFHAKIGAAIGSGPKEARERRFGRDPSFSHHLGRPVHAPGASPEWPATLRDKEESSEERDYMRFEDAAPRLSPALLGARPTPESGSESTGNEALRDHSCHGEGIGGSHARASELRHLALARQRQTQLRRLQAPLNFSIFYNEHCVWLATVVNGSFVIGVLASWSSVWFLLWNQFPHLMYPIAGFAAVGLLAMVISGRMEHQTRKRDRLMGEMLRSDGISAPRAIAPPSPPAVPSRPPVPRHCNSWPATSTTLPAANGAPSPPPSPPLGQHLTTSPQRDLQPPLERAAERRLPSAWSAADRLRYLQALMDERLLSRSEYDDKRREILATL